MDKIKLGWVFQMHEQEVGEDDVWKFDIGGTEI